MKQNEKTTHTYERFLYPAKRLNGSANDQKLLIVVRRNSPFAGPKRKPWPQVSVSLTSRKTWLLFLLHLNEPAIISKGYTLALTK